MSRFIEAAPANEASSMTSMKMGALILAIFLAAGGLDLSQAMFASLGACVYALIRTMQSEPDIAKQIEPKEGHSKKRGGRAAASSREREPHELHERTLRKQQARVACALAQSQKPQKQLPSGGPGRASNNSIRQTSARPVPAPTFAAVGFDNEVEELVARLLPTPEGDAVLQGIVATIKSAVLQILPEADVTGFACSDPRRGGAFGVAVPEVDVVISVKPTILAERMKFRAMGQGWNANDHWKVNKIALRAITTQLVSCSGFKFRRSGFRIHEPKVTLLSPHAHSDLQDTMAMDVSVNSISPLWHAALLTECGYIEPRARALILLVRRWAKDRAVCHVAKGHVSPPAWSLLAIYFLQVGVTGEGALLPPLDGFEMASQIVCADSLHTTSSPVQWSQPRGDGPKKSVAELFRDFFVFYHSVFDWRGEAVSIRTARRASPGLRLPLHVVLNGNGETDVGPSIEDPFDCARNLGATITSSSLSRVNQEIARAAAMCSSGKPLTDLLVPWAPPEVLGTEQEQISLEQDRIDEQQLVNEAAKQAEMARDVQLSGGPLAWLDSAQEDNDDLEALSVTSSPQFKPQPPPGPMLTPNAHGAAMFNPYVDESQGTSWGQAHDYQYVSLPATSDFQYQ